MSDTVTFNAELSRWLAQVEARRTMLSVNTANAILNSITEGSAVTGAPGQPVDTGALKTSWNLLWESPTILALISTNIAYAPVIEENNRAAYDARGNQPEKPQNPDGSWRRPVKSTVGGHHSVKLTRANFDALVRQELRMVIEETG